METSIKRCQLPSNRTSPTTMFKKFSKEDVHTRTNVKSSVQRGLKTKVVSQFQDLEPVIDDIIPKKSQVEVLKCEDKIQLFIADGEVVLFQQFDELIPSLKIVHKYPHAFPSVKVDRGAIKFVLSGANVMCPGLTSKGAQLPEAPGLEKDVLVAIYAEGKEHALAIGKLNMSTEEIKSINKGIGIEMFHYLGDGLWNFHAD